MSEHPTASSLQDGLSAFYSSEAEAALTKYENINHLLGTTSHHAHPGSLCEALIRDVLRRNVLQWMSVDKGYVYGRSVRALDGKEDHSPEIDILIHDTLNCRPMFRMADFVIVQPDAAMGLIQIKKKLTSKEIFKGLVNVAEAKRHALELRRRPIMPHRLFSAVIGLAKGSKKGEATAIRSNLLKLADVYRPVLPRIVGPGSFVSFLLPQFIGSLEGCYAASGDVLPLPVERNPLKHTYHIFESSHDGKNYFLQHVLVWLASTIFPAGAIAPPQAPPYGRNTIDTVELDFGEYDRTGGPLPPKDARSPSASTASASK
jgi:uncharacterized protein DUF6602